ncbi:MAG TPA: hypothetical protein VHB93_00665 [Candidatus Paceibacterota bacterium]|nr:hypothetical protein [Candidatus Paceibacterota bacterium]
MSRKTLVWGGMIVGSSVGGLLPYLWGNYNFFSFSSVVLTAVGGIVGIWIGWKLAG